MSILMIYRAAELSDEVQRLRPTRFIQTDGIIRPFVHREAEGNQILLVCSAISCVFTQLCTDFPSLHCEVFLAKEVLTKYFYFFINDLIVLMFCC